MALGPPNEASIRKPPVDRARLSQATMGGPPERVVHDAERVSSVSVPGRRPGLAQSGMRL